MKFVTTFLCFIIFLTSISCQTSDHPALITTPKLKPGQENPVPALTEKEKQSFNSLVTSQIDWFLDWRYPEIHCQDGKIDIATNYQRLVGQQINLKLVITRKYVFSYFAQLHFRIIFLRDMEHGLTGPSLQPFCESTNDEAISWFKSSDEPLLGSEPIYQENREYTVPAQSAQIVEYPGKWSTEKKMLSEKITQAISDNLKEIECHPNQVLSVAIPHFNLTDPEVDFFVRSAPAGDEFLGWAIVSRNSKGEYKIAVANKRFYIVENPQDENQLFHQTLSKKIKQRKVAELLINCSKND